VPTFSAGSSRSRGDKHNDLLDNTVDLAQIKGSSCQAGRAQPAQGQLGKHA